MLFFHLRYMRSCGVEARLVRHILDAHLQRKVIIMKQIFRNYELGLCMLLKIGSWQEFLT